MGLFDSLHFAVIGLYLLGTVLFFTGLAMSNDKLKRVSMGMALAAFGAHTLDLVLLLTGSGGVLVHGNLYFSLIGWCMVLLYFFLWWKLRLEFLAVTALPLALLLYTAFLAFGGIRVVMPPRLTVLFFGLHIGSLVITLGLLALAFGAAVAFLYYNKKIKSKAGLRAMGKDTPSLDRFDTVNRWAVAVGFPLYTLGLFSSFFWYMISPDKIFSWDIMKIASIVVWFAYAFLFHQRLVLGWRGRKPAITTIWVFAGMVVSLIHHTITFRV